MKELSRTPWFYSHFDNLKASPSPVTGTAASVGHGDDVDGGVCRSVITEQGKRRMRNFLVPCTCSGQRSGLSAILVTAPSRAAMKAFAAERLRSAYHSYAACASLIASG